MGCSDSLQCFSVFYFTDSCSKIYFLSSVCFHLNCSPLATFLGWKIRLLISYLSSFLIYAFNVIHSPLSTTFAASHVFDKLYFYFNLVQNFSVIIYLKAFSSTHGLFRNVLISKHFPAIFLLLISSLIPLVVQEHAL